MDDAPETNLHPLALAMLFASWIWILSAKRQNAGLPMLIMACFVSPAQKLVVGGASLYAIRMLILVGLFRVFSRRENAAIRWNRVDSFMTCWTIFGTLVYVVQQGSSQSLIFKLGQAIDEAGAYFLFRCFVTDVDDVVRYIRWFAVIAIPISLAFIFEYSTRYNPFSIFGGVSAVTEIREGRLRCQGAFAISILAGTFWATIVPNFVALGLRSARDRTLALIATVGSFIVIITCSSSTPLLGVAAALFGLMAYRIKQYMRVVRWSTVVLLCVLQVVMATPVWSLLARVNLVAGSTGYYRYRLLDAAINHVDQWWLLGLKSNASWGDEWGHYLTDITNQYVMEGLRGGMVGLLCFVGALWAAFSRVGRLWRAQQDSRNRFMMWSLGISLAVHATCFFAVSYFGQIVMLFDLHLALIASVPITKRDHQSRHPKFVLPANAGLVVGETAYA